MHEYVRDIETLLGTIRDQHYKSPRGAELYKQLRERLRENDNRVSNPSASKQPAVPTPAKKSAPTSEKKKDVVYLVETSTLMHVGMNRLLSLDNGEARFYVPRFCVDDLEKMSRDDPRAKDALTRMYDKEIFEKRFFPLPDVSTEDSIFKDSAMRAQYKRRSFSIVDVAVELALSDVSNNSIVKIITTSREVCDLTREVITSEGLEGLLTFVLARRNT